MKGRRALLGLQVCLGALASLQCSRADTGAPSRNPDEVWLARVGTGPAQTARVCARGASDRIARLLCDPAVPPIRSLSDLYRALRLDQPAAQLAAATIHSLSLSGRTVSSLNPRVFAFQNISDKSRQPTPEQVVITAFVRGEQLVEMAAFDPVTYDFNFYLLRFEQGCNRHRCTPEDLLTEDVEHSWTGWTLYSDRDLEDTPLDCVSCHQPWGPGTHRQFLMRQFLDPWVHWGEFRGGTQRTICPVPPPDGSPGKMVGVAEGLDLLRAVEGTEGRYAAIPIRSLHAAKSGEIFSTFLTDAEGLSRLSPYGMVTNYRYEQLYISSREILCERFDTGTSPTWDRERRLARQQGLPMPFYGPDVVDAGRRTELLQGKREFLRRHQRDDAFDVAAAFLSPEVPEAVGFVPNAEEDAETILRGMCLRCHSNATDTRLRRARFNVEAVGQVPPQVAHAVRRRLALPRTSPEAMPPRRAGGLPPWAVERINNYLGEHCTEPGACD